MVVREHSKCTRPLSLVSNCDYDVWREMVVLFTSKGYSFSLYFFSASSALAKSRITPLIQ